MNFARTILLTLLTATATVSAGDWPHIMGPRFDRKTDETIAQPWPARGPKRLWQISAEGGFSSFVTGDGRAYTVVAMRGRETVIAVDRKSGKTVWQTPLGPTGYANGGDRGVPGNNGGDGPRATPVFAGGRVYIFGGKFDLYALDGATGRVVWKHDLLREFGGREIHWSNAASPLVLADRVIVAGGGRGQSFLAFKPDTGALIWKAGNDRPTYSTPVPATIHGQEQVLFMVDRGAVSIDPASGRELWHYPFPQQTATACSPVVWQDIVNCSAGYGVGGAGFRVTRSGEKWDVDELWRSRGNRDTASHWMTAVAHDGYLYGCYGHGAYGSGAFKCIDIRTGQVQWEKRGFGHGQTIMAGKHLVAISDAGQLVLLEPTPKSYRELAKADVIDGKVWASLALSAGQLLVRSTTQGVCLEL